MPLNANDIAASYGATLAIAEVGLGSLLHTLKLPFSGQFLSLNQGYFLCRASIEALPNRRARTVALPVSVISALLKSFSPSGKKLTPMMAIAVQGTLFTVGTACFGVGVLGLTVGMILLSLWAFLQPLAIAYLLFGQTLFSAAQFFWQEAQNHFSLPADSLKWGVGLLVGTKLIFAIAIVALAYKAPWSLARAYESWLLRAGKTFRPRPANLETSSLRHPVYSALRDLTSPWFVLSLGLTLFFFFFSQSPLSRLPALILRPLAAGFVFFLIVRLFPIQKVASVLEKGRFPELGRALRRASELLLETRQST